MLDVPIATFDCRRVNHPKSVGVIHFGSFTSHSVIHLWGGCVCSQCQNYRTEPGVQKYGKIPYLRTPPDPHSARDKPTIWGWFADHLGMV